MPQKQGAAFYSYTGTVENTVFRISFNVLFENSTSYRVPTHNHPCYEVHGVLNGSYSFTADGNPVHLSSGDCCILPPFLFHSFQEGLSMGAKRYCFRFECISKNTSLAQHFAALDQLVVLPQMEKVLLLLGEISDELTSKRVGYAAAIDSLLARSFVLLIRELVRQGGESLPNSFHTTEELRAMEIDAFFARCYQSDIRAEQLAQLLHISTRQLDRIMRQLYQMSFRQKLFNMRFFVAKDLLSTTHHTIQYISEVVGYHNVGYFCAAFKKETKLTPMQYRRKHQSQFSSTL